MARLIEFFSRTGELVLDPFAGRRRHAARGGHRARPAARHRHRARPALGRGLRDGRPRPRGRARRRRARPSPTSAPPTRAARAASTRPAWSCALGDALAVLPTIAGRLDRLRRDRPAVQHPAAADDGRRRARRDPRQPADRLRDGQRRRRPTSPTPPDYPTFLDRMGAVFVELARVLRAGPLRGRHRPRRVPGRPLPVRRLGPGGARVERRASCPRATSSGTRPARGCGRTAIRGSFVPNIAHQHILVLRREPTRRRQARRRLSR